MSLWKSILLLTSLVLHALGQSASLVFPTNGTDITPGSELVIVVQQAVSLPPLHPIPPQYPLN